MSTYGEITYNGFWKQNSILAQVLGLCPTLAVTTTFTNAVSLGLATAFVMGMSNLTASALRSYIPYEIRIPVFILIIASLVTVVDLAFNAWLHEIYVILGIFIPLIVTNCIVLARVEAFASKRSTTHSILDGTMMGLGLTGVLVTLGAVREIIGKGTLLSGIDLALGPMAKDWVIPIIPHYPGLLLAILPPGAFIGLGALIALRNVLQERRATRVPVQTAPATP